MPISLCGAAVVLSLNGLILLGGQERLKNNDSKIQILSLKKNQTRCNSTILMPFDFVVF